MSIYFELVTPERLVFHQDIDEAILPTSEGEIAILPHHIALIATLVPGVMRLKKGNVEEHVAVSGGFIEVLSDNKVRVLADSAERGSDLDVSVIETAKQRAEQLMRQAVRSDDGSFAAAAAAMERELARYRVAHRHSRSTHVPMIDAGLISDSENST